MTNYIIGFVTLVFGIAALYVIAQSRPHVASAPPVQPAITAITIKQPNIVVTAANLKRVELWEVPTGTNVTENDYQKVDTMNLAKTDPDGVQTWTLLIPSAPILATQIFAKGFDSDGNEVGRVVLPATGASELYDELWGSSQSASQ